MTLRLPTPADIRPSTSLGDAVLAALAELSPRAVDLDPPHRYAPGCGCDACFAEELEREALPEEPAVAVIRLRRAHRPLVARDEVVRAGRRPDLRAEGGAL